MSLKSEVEKMPGYNSLVKPWHFVRALGAGAKNGWPAKKMKVIAVTGTNGKTSTCFFIWKMLNEAGHRTGVMTTVGWGVEQIEPQIEHMTTESVGILNARMRKIQEMGAEYLVLETTSHALSQSRLLGVPVEMAVFTNLTPEHLDYHKTFEKYRAAKLKLFRRAKFGAINADDESANWFSSAILSSKSPVRGSSTSSTTSLRASTSPRTSSKITAFADSNSLGDIITYGIEKGNLRATEVELLPTGVKYACGDIKIETQVPGKFNVYNSLAAVAVGQKVGLSNEEIAKGIHALDSVEGRMTDVKCGQDFTVIVDYAHQPDALEKVFNSLCGDLSSSDSVMLSGSNPPTEGRDPDPHQPGYNPQKASSPQRLPKTFSSTVGESVSDGSERLQRPRIISVHGGAGRRDHGTREPRGEILGKYSDVVIITEDDSRDEDPAEIAEMFAVGAEKMGKVRGEDLIIELDREKAIRKALSMAKKGDLVLILGKGHEKTILRNDGPHEFEDIKVVERILRKA